MVSVLTRIFGLAHLETIEDAVQDSFYNASLKWRKRIPDNPEAWLTLSAKNRAIDLLRKIKAEKERSGKLLRSPAVVAMDDLFLEHEIEDSQLRMIFTSCNPSLKPQDQISFALKTVAGFGTKEIASALLLNVETIKKRLARARKEIKTYNIKFTVPDKYQTVERVDRVLNSIYLIFNEGFHSNQKDKIIREDLCGEELRLCQILLKRKMYRLPQVYALLGLMCFQSSRLESKISLDGNIINLKN